MPNCFSQLWTGSEYTRQRTVSAVQPLLLHAVSSEFQRRGIRAGDLLYVWSFIKGKLFLIGRMEIDEIASSVRAAARLGRPEISDAADHALARSCTPKRFNLEVPPGVIEELRFVTASGQVTPPKCRLDGQLDPQTFRGVRKLTAHTAALLDRLLDS